MNASVPYIGYYSTYAFNSLVFVTGLAGHAFGSWKAPGEHTMWIRDFLAKDLSHKVSGKPRILTYGYDTKLLANTSNAGIREFSRAFLEAIKNARRLPDVRIHYIESRLRKGVTHTNLYLTIRKVSVPLFLWPIAWGVLWSSR